MLLFVPWLQHWDQRDLKPWQEMPPSSIGMGHTKAVVLRSTACKKLAAINNIISFQEVLIALYSYVTGTTENVGMCLKAHPDGK